MTLPASEETVVPATDEEVFGPYEPVFIGPAVWAGISDELPPQLVGKRVWISTFDPSARIHSAREQAVRECAENVWQPIETAPKDGTHFIGWDENTGAVETYWYVHPVVQAWVAVEIDCNDYEFEPTLWVPKPLSLSQVSAKK